MRSECVVEGERDGECGVSKCDCIGQVSERRTGRFSCEVIRS